MTTSETAAASAAFSASATGERADILSTLQTHRYFLRHTVDGLSDEQARLTPTASELCLGGLIKHVSAIEAGWADFAERGTEAMPAVDGEPTPEVIEWFHNQFRLLPGETVAGVLAEAATGTPLVRLAVRERPRSGPPEALLGAAGIDAKHIVAETAQHAGHADIIRETIDGQKTMG